MTSTSPTALVFAAGGAIGSTAVRHLGLAGFRVLASGRDADAVARACPPGTAVERVDATDPAQVDAYVDRIARESGRIDVVFNAIGPRAAEAGYCVPSSALALDTFLLPLRMIVASQFLTARAAARSMRAAGRGSIVMLSAILAARPAPLMAGISAASGAIESLGRSLAAEYGADGVRVNCVRPAGIPDTRTILEAAARRREALGLSRPQEDAPVGNALQRPVTLDEVGRVVAFLGSDAASGITAQVVNVCAGTIT
jgi:NAD(P)-dependent dehydrogenase (short-subunit alcohol dehydrogenase family)